MNSIRQLFRSPWKTLLGIILVLLACTLLCVSIGQYDASIQAQRKVEQDYTTIALPTNKYKIQKILDEDGNVISITYLSSQPEEVRSFLSGLPERYPDIVRSVEQHGFLSGYCGDLSPLNYTATASLPKGDAMTAIDTAPYTCALLVISIDEISAPRPYMTEDMVWGDMNPENYGVVTDVDGTVREVYSLQEGYESPVGRTIHLELRTESEDAFSALNLEIGETYLVYGTNYMDLDWNLRCKIANGNRAIYDSISWSNIAILTEEEKAHYNAQNDLFGIDSEYVAIYAGSYLLNEIELAYVESCSMTVCSNPSILTGQMKETEVPIYAADGIGSMPIDEYNRLYQQAGIVRLDDDPETPDARLWSDARNTARINDHSFPVIATDNLQSVAQFGAQDALITSGRMFSQEEYRNGALACVISESLAVQNGLTVGDTITIAYYEPDFNLPGQTFLKTANVTPAYYSSVKGFSGEALTYEIVGLYRQKEEWTESEYAFTPNTIFVPKSSVSCQAATSDSGIFCTYVLKNGRIEQMQEVLSANGYEGLLSYYDQGYSDIAGSLSDYFSVVRVILWIGLGSWVVMIAVFLFLFPGHQKREAERMWTLGAPETWIVKQIFCSGLGIVLPGVILGSAVTACVLPPVLSKIGSYSNMHLELQQSVPLVVAAILAQLICLMGLLFLAAKISARSLQKR